MVGEVRGRWRVLRQNGNVNGDAMWTCECECGTERDVSGYSLRVGSSKSCGCYFSEELAKRNSEKKTHGRSHTRLYDSWYKLNKRCYDDNNKDYQDYGGRGIRVCDDWRNDINVFWDWSINNGYNDNLTIDRIDVDGNYEPNNCRWATPIQQGRNRRNNRMITIGGQTKCVSEWSEISGVNRKTIMSRLRYGWVGERLISKVK